MVTEGILAKLETLVDMEVLILIVLDYGHWAIVIGAIGGFFS